MSLLPRSPDVVSDAGPRVVGVDSEAADTLMSALSSETARRILVELHEEPAPPAELADRAETTLQNAQYHLSNLEDAGAIDVVGTAYSEKGREMDVYAPADEPLVIFAGREEAASGLRAALTRLLGGLSALAVGSLVVQDLFGRRSLASFLPTGPLAGAGSSEPAGVGGPTATGTGETPTEAVATATPSPKSEAGGAGPPAGDGAATNVTGTPASTGTATPAEAGTSAAQHPPTPTPEQVATETATEIARETAANVSATPRATRAAGEAAAALPPGLLFFLGGALVLVVGIVLTHGGLGGND